jgi:hypothetical protein
VSYRESNYQSRQPSKALRRLVKSSFDDIALARICEQQDFSDYADRVDLAWSMGHPRFYYHADRGSDVLAIAHLDSVQDDGRCSIVETSAGPLACSGTLDDRLGAYVILEMLPALGIHTDILLTTDEEICQSTGEDFEPAKRYNWMFQFDRGGTDVVMYDYETPYLVELVEEAGAQVGIGSFSDIRAMTHMGCAGFNWGVGYQDYHSTRSHAWLDDTFRMVARFVKFYEANSEHKLYHDEDDPWRYMEADCGHEIDCNDESTYFEWGDDAGRKSLVCIKCMEFEDAG